MKGRIAKFYSSYLKISSEGDVNGTRPSRGEAEEKKSVKYELKEYYMRNVKWSMVALSLLLVSFVDKDNLFSGHDVGDKAPLFTLAAPIEGSSPLNLRDLKGEYVLLSFWASYDAPSRMQNVQLSRVAAQMPDKLKMVSVSFDEYRSVFSETVKNDKIDPTGSFVELAGEKSPLFKQYRLKRGFKNYLLNPEGVIIAKDVQADELADYIEKKAES